MWCNLKSNWKSVRIESLVTGLSPESTLNFFQLSYHRKQQRVRKWCELKFMIYVTGILLDRVIHFYIPSLCKNFTFWTCMNLRSPHIGHKIFFPDFVNLLFWSRFSPFIYQRHTLHPNLQTFSRTGLPLIFEFWILPYFLLHNGKSHLKGKDVVHQKF